MKSRFYTSVIIPTLNEALALRDAVKTVRKACKVEVIIVDGGSEDNTLELANELADKVLSSQPSRGRQMDLGAKEAKGEILLFLHADTLLPDNWDVKIRRAVENGSIGGAFTLSFNSSNRFLRLTAFVANQRSRFFGITYGDQAIFVKKEVFASPNINGFMGLPIFEDIDLWRRLKKSGRLIVLKEKVIVSARKWDRVGSVKNTLKNWLFIVLYYFKVSPEFIYKLYYK